MADLLAVRLHEPGLRPGDALVVQLPNRWEFVPLLAACVRVGLPVMALPAHREREWAHLLSVSEAAAIVVPDAHRGFDHQQLAATVAERTQRRIHVVVAGRASAGHTALDALLDAEPDPREVALFLFSGGTTGVPKLILRTHDDYDYTARLSAAMAGIDDTATYLVTLPAGHNFPGILGTARVHLSERRPPPPQVA